MVRLRGVAPAAQSLAGRTASAGRAGGCANTRTFPGLVATPDRTPARHRRVGAGDRPALWGGAAGIRLGVDRAAVTGARLLPGDARRADRHGRSAVVGVWLLAGQRRLGEPAPGGRRGGDPGGGRPFDRDRKYRVRRTRARGARRALPRRRVLLPSALGDRKS